MGGKKNFLVDEIPHFLNESTDGRSSVTVVGAMPSFGWVAHFFWLDYPTFCWLLVKLY